MPSKTPAGGVLFSHTRRFVVVALAVWMVMALAAPVSADAGTGRGPAVSGAGGPQITWAACGPHEECASVPVPLDWAHPNGPTIALAVARHLASHPQQRIGSLFVNPGGPGDSGVGYVGERGQALDTMTGGRFDIVGWDLRGGAGASPRDPSTCVMQATSSYLVNLTTPSPGTVCPSDRLPFDPGFGQPVP